MEFWRTSPNRFELTNARRPADQVASSSAPEKTARVLVVTDNEDVRDELRWAFSTDVEVVLAREARDAWAAMQEDVPSMVVVDLQTGSAGGFALSHDMDATERLRSVPVLILLEREQDAWLAGQAGADAFLVKPVEAGTIVARANEILGR